MYQCFKQEEPMIGENLQVIVSSKQQWPTVQYKKVYSIFHNNLYGRRIWQRIYACITESLCRALETNTTLWTNYAAAAAQSCPTLCDPRDCSPPGSSVHRIPQARILEWVAMPSSRGSSWTRDRTRVSWMTGRFSTTEQPEKPVN